MVSQSERDPMTTPTRGRLLLWELTQRPRIVDTQRERVFVGAPSPMATRHQTQTPAPAYGETDVAAAPHRPRPHRRRRIVLRVLAGIVVVLGLLVVAGAAWL